MHDCPKFISSFYELESTTIQRSYYRQGEKNSFHIKALRIVGEFYFPLRYFASLPAGSAVKINRIYRHTCQRFEASFSIDKPLDEHYNIWTLSHSWSVVPFPFDLLRQQRRFVPLSRQRASATKQSRLANSQRTSTSKEGRAKRAEEGLHAERARETIAQKFPAKSNDKTSNRCECNRNFASLDSTVAWTTDTKPRRLDSLHFLSRHVVVHSGTVLHAVSFSRFYLSAPLLPNLSTLFFIFLYPRLFYLPLWNRFTLSNHHPWRFSSAFHSVLRSNTVLCELPRFSIFHRLLVSLLELLSSNFRFAAILRWNPMIFRTTETLVDMQLYCRRLSLG